MGWSILKKKLEEEEAAVVFIISPLLSDCHIDQLLVLRLLGWYKLVFVVVSPPLENMTSSQLAFLILCISLPLKNTYIV